MSAPPKLPDPKPVPRGWIPPPPYRLRSIFDHSLPGGKITLLENNKKAGVCPVVFVEGIELDTDWQTWLSSPKEETATTLPLDFDAECID